LTSAALGACAGATLALTGAGGASVAVPLPMVGLPLSVIQAAPIGLLAVASSAALGAFLGLRSGIVSGPRLRQAFAVIAGFSAFSLVPRVVMEHV